MVVTIQTIGNTLEVNVLSIIGTRPQFVRIPPLDRCLREKGISHTIINTSQHYDLEMSSNFLEEFEIKNIKSLQRPNSSSSIIRFAEMLTRIEQYFYDGRVDFDAVIVYGDTDSTLAGALWAKRRGFPVIHVESGLRSKNQKMLEEINRILVDHISDLHLAPSKIAMKNLENEGLGRSSVFVGDILMDHLIEVEDSNLNSMQLMFQQLGINEFRKYYVVSFHRNEAVTSPAKLKEIVANLNLASELTLVLGHPKLVNYLKEFDLQLSGKAKLINPLSHSEVLKLIRNSSGVMTDSGGLQRESALLGIPTLISRNETEWIELLDYENVMLKNNTDEWENSLKSLPRTETKLSDIGFSAEKSSEAIYEFVLRTKS